MKKKIIIALALVLCLTLSLFAFASADVEPETYEGVYQGEFKDGDLEGDATIVFGTVDPAAESYGISIDYYGDSRENTPINEVRSGKSISQDGKFGIALFNLPEGYFTAKVFADGEFGDEVVFAVGDAYQTVQVTYVATGEENKVVDVAYGAKFGDIEKATKTNYTPVYTIDGVAVADDFVITEDTTIDVEYQPWFTVDDFKGDGEHGTVKNADGSYTVKNPGNGGSVALAMSDYTMADNFEISFKVTGSDPTKFDIGVRLYNADYSPWLSHFIPLYSENYVRGEQVFPGWLFNDSGYAGFFGNTKNALESGAYYVKYVKNGTASWLYVGESLSSMDCYGYDNPAWNCFAPQTAIPTVEIKSKATGDANVTISEITYEKLIAVTYVASGESNQVKYVKAGTTFANVAKATKANHTPVYTIDGQVVANDYAFNADTTIDVEYQPWFTVDDFKGSDEHGVTKNADGSYTIKNPGYVTDDNGAQILAFSDIATAEKFEFSFKVTCTDPTYFDTGIVLFDSSLNAATYPSWFTLLYNANANTLYAQGVRRDPFAYNTGYAENMPVMANTMETGVYYVRYVKDGTKSWLAYGPSFDLMETISYDADWNSFAAQSAIPAIKIRSKAAGDESVTISEINYHVPTDAEYKFFSGSAAQWADNATFRGWQTSYTRYSVGIPNHYTALQPKDIAAAENFTISYKIHLPATANPAFGILYKHSTDYNGKCEYIIIRPKDGTYQAVKYAFDGTQGCLDWNIFDDSLKSIVTDNDFYVKVVHRGQKTEMYIGKTLDSMTRVAIYELDWNCNYETATIPMLCVTGGDSTSTERVAFSEVNYTVDVVD